MTNVILPKDIGVTYDMIGGLGGAKELLRQCITYPLRFPHLYNEGIAKEAVKGVLLFGPPGTEPPSSLFRRRRVSFSGGVVSVKHPGEDRGDATFSCVHSSVRWCVCARAPCVVCGRREEDRLLFDSTGLAQVTRSPPRLARRRRELTQEYKMSILRYGKKGQPRMVIEIRYATIPPGGARPHVHT